MEKYIAAGASGLFGIVSLTIKHVSTLFSQVPEGTIPSLPEIGITIVVVIVLYKIIMKLIDGLAKSIIDKIEDHDKSSGKKLDEIDRVVRDTGRRLDNLNGSGASGKDPARD